MSDRKAWSWALMVILVVGLLPYTALLWHVPWGADAGKWLERGALDSPGWFEWLFERKHFIGYRPVTAVTFTLNWLTTGYAPWAYRVTDLALHASVGAWLFELHRRLDPGRAIWGLLALVLLFAHPATEEVLPFVARRSYLLAASFGSGALVAHLVGLRAARPWPWQALAALLLGLGVFSNEGAYVLVGVMPALAVAERGLRGRPLVDGLLQGVPAAAVVAATLVWRVHILGSLTGGYDKHYFAFVRAGHVAWRVETTPDPVAILQACWAYLLSPHGVTGAQALFPGGLRWTILGSLLAVTVARPLAFRHEPRALTPLVYVAWFAGASAVVAASGTWFWRQAYFLLPVLGLSVAWAASRCVDDLRARRWVWVLAAVPLVVGAPLAALWTGPTFVGMNPYAHTSRIQATDLIYGIEAATRDLKGPGEVFLVLPIKSSSAHQVRMWADRFADPALDFRVIAHPDQGKPATDGAVTVEEQADGRYVMRLDPEHMGFVGKETRRARDGALYLDTLGRPDATRWVVWFDAERRPHILTLPPQR